MLGSSVWTAHRARHRGLAAVLLAALACNTPATPTPAPTPTPTPAQAPPPTTPTTATPTPEASTIDPAVIKSAERERGTAEGAKRAAERLRAGARGDALWGAVYVYSTDGDDPALLVPLTAHEDATIRVLAAGGLLRMGDRAGFPPLIAETDNAAILAGSEPPQSIGEIAGIMLTMASGKDIPLTPSPAAEAAWRAWYTAHEAALKYDPKTGWSPT